MILGSFFIKRAVENGGFLIKILSSSSSSSSSSHGIFTVA